MLFLVEQAFVARDEIPAPLKMPAWEAIQLHVAHLGECQSAKWEVISSNPDGPTLRLIK